MKLGFINKKECQSEFPYRLLTDFTKFFHDKKKNQIRLKFKGLQRYL